jgi:enterochelin esterase-like enzyme
VRLHSSRLADGRRVTVYLPSSARARPRRPYSLLVLHDGQNLFEPDRAFVTGQHWRVGETADRLIASRAIPPVVICGVDHGAEARIKEMTPTPGPDSAGGGARRYGGMIVDEVLPLIRAEFPVRRDREGTALGGSSLGGLVTLSTLLEHPGVFAGALAMSPSIWWDGRVILRRIVRRPGALDGMRLWVDIGLDEGAKAVGDARRLAKLLAQLNTRPARPTFELSYIEEPGANHSERSWAGRFGRALTYLFGAR